MRLFLIRHGEPRQHSDRIFLGQTDVPLSERGREQAIAASDELTRLQCRPGRIYSSDLLRARETAEIISARIGGVKIVNVAAFRELNMGVWDGELIEDIKRRFPDEYVKRGDDILNYRVSGGENFHDLRERVMSEFHRILREAASENPGLCVTLPRQNTHLPCVNSAFVSAASLDSGVFGGCREEFSPALRVGGSTDLVIVSHLGVIQTMIAELTREDMNTVMQRRRPTGTVVYLNIHEDSTAAVQTGADVKVRADRAEDIV